MPKRFNVTGIKAALSQRMTYLYHGIHLQRGWSEGLAEY